jgi:5-oxopent-3-ene-1,2,5-tricarboxylate decarboxylase / 2-hydroxyhepta-2,4-diene-1,7-dioate isomerase
LTEDTGPTSLDAATLDGLGRVATATLAAQLRQRGLDSVVLGGLTALRPDLRLVGLARTLRFLPYREDLAASMGMGVQRRGLETLGPGDVLVMEARGEMSAGTIGDISALRAVKLGIAGIVTDGPIRDGDVIATFDVPVYAAGRHPSAPSRRHVPWAMDVAVACAGVLIEPGDVLVGDADGLLVIPPGVAAEVARGALEQEREEGYVAARVAEGESLDGLFPMGPLWRERYETWSSEHPA